METHKYYPYMINCGAFETMQAIAEHGKRGLNRKTHRWQVISKSAKYRVVYTGSVFDEEGKEHRLADLYCNQNLREIAESKDLIFN